VQAAVASATINNKSACFIFMLVLLKIMPVSQCQNPA
jgi:hypothetical protein